MALSWIRKMFEKKSRPIIRSGRKHPGQGRFVPALDCLEDRVLPAITALFVPQAGLLTVVGDAGNNAIAVSRDAAGKILVNGGAVTVLGGTPTVANTATISVLGLGGDDAISLDESVLSASLPE